jgi:hypothetical protein
LPGREDKKREPGKKDKKTALFPAGDKSGRISRERTNNLNKGPPLANEKSSRLEEALSSMPFLPAIFPRSTATRAHRHRANEKISRGHPGGERKPPSPVSYDADPQSAAEDEGGSEKNDHRQNKWLFFPKVAGGFSFCFWHWPPATFRLFISALHP